MILIALGVSAGLPAMPIFTHPSIFEEMRQAHAAQNNRDIGF